MPNYSSLSTQIEGIKSEITASLAVGTYSAQDLVYAAKALEALSNIVVPDGTPELTVNDKLYVGDAAENFSTVAALTNPVAVFETSANDYAQIAFVNRSSSADASTDFIAYSNNGDDNSGWINMGITSSNFADPDFTITGAGDGYIFVSGSSQGSTDRGNLVLATNNTGTQNKIIFAAGGLDSDATQMEITPNQNVHIEINTPSTSPTTGALTVVGGVGIQGDVNIQGSITFGGTGTTVETDNLSVVDPMVYVGTENSADALDMGLVGTYVTGGNTRYAGVVRDASDGVMKFFQNATTKPLTTVNFAEGGLAYASIKVAGVEADSASIGDVSNTELQYLNGVTSAIQTQLDSKLSISSAGSTYAPLASPSFTGVPTAPTPDAGTNNGQIATTSFVSTAIGNLIASAPEALNTLDELAAALNDDANFATTVTNSLAAKAPLASPTFTGTVTISGGAVITGTTDVQEIRENIVPITLSSNLATCNWTEGNIFYVATAATGAVTINLTNVPTDINKMMTINFILTQDATGRLPSTFQIDGATQTIRWPGGSAPTPTAGAGKIDIFSFTMQRTGSNTWIVYGASSLNF